MAKLRGTRRISNGWAYPFPGWDMKWYFYDFRTYDTHDKVRRMRDAKIRELRAQLKELKQEVL